MAHRTFVSSRKIYLAFLVGLLGVVFLPTFISMSYFAFVGLYMYLFRKNRSPHVDRVAYSQGVTLSPISGKVLSIGSVDYHPTFGKHLKYIEAQIPHFKEAGLYLPFSGEVVELKMNKGSSSYRYRDELFSQFFSKGIARKSYEHEGLSLSLKHKSGEIIGLDLLKCYLGAHPKVWIRVGDRGHAGSNFGHIPLGGIVFIYLPKDQEILVSPGDQLIAAQTLVTGGQ